MTKLVHAIGTHGQVATNKAGRGQSKARNGSGGIFGPVTNPLQSLIGHLAHGWAAGLVPRCCFASLLRGVRQRKLLP